MEGVETQPAANVEAERAVAVVAQSHFVVGEDVGVGDKKLLEQGFAVGGRGVSRLTRFDLSR